MKNTRINFWLLFRKTLWSLLVRYDKVGSLWFRVRPLLFFGTLLSFPIIFSLFYGDYKDYSVSFPTVEQTMISEGNLSEVKINRIFHYQLITSKGEKIILNGPLKSKKGMFYNEETKQWLSHPATVRWFMLPSGKGFIVELWMNGKQYVNMTEAYSVFNKLKNSNFPIIILLVWVGMCLLSAISEFMYVRKKLLEKNTLPL